ncbi:MAG: hypothetical protein WKG52_10745, partial [Variovorax sp.]
MPAPGQACEVLVARCIAQAIDHHVGAAAGMLHRVGKTVVARHDHMLAAVLARDTRLLFARHGAQ